MMHSSLHNGLDVYADRGGDFAHLVVVVVVGRDEHHGGALAQLHELGPDRAVAWLIVDAEQRLPQRFLIGERDIATDGDRP